MKLYMHPASTTSRPVVHFIADNGLDVELQVVDLMKGEHKGDSYAKLNPSRMVPMLEDGDFRLTESATILRYLAAKTGSPAYPTELRARARVDEMLDWFNSQFYRDWGYGFVYPQCFPQMKRADPKAQESVLALGKQGSLAWFQVLNDHWIGPRKSHLCGDTVTIADYFGFALASIGEVIQCDFKAFPNVARWLAAIKRRSGYAEAYGAFAGMVEGAKAHRFETL